jgi:hypothetical protein
LAKGDFPGPLPILARLDVVDEVQLAKVAADGACAATLSLHLNGQERTKELMEAANGYGLETVRGSTSFTPSPPLLYPSGQGLPHFFSPLPHP